MAKQLQIHQHGKGKPLVVIHGWGMNQHVWQPIKQALEQHFSVYWLDLPGHGINQALLLGSMDDVSALIAEHISEQSIILAWSLGGLIAQNIALQQPNKVSELILVASSLSFVQRDHWQNAMQAETLAGFIDNLQADFEGTLKRFLALQFMKVKNVQRQVKQLREDLLANPPSKAALSDGLKILQTADFTRAEQTIKSHWILGELDRLIPKTVADDLAKQPNSQVDVIAGAGHAPFISHPDEFMQSVLSHV